MLGIHNVNYKNSNIDFDFGFSKKNLDVSLHHQGEYGGNYADYAEMLTCLDNLVENAELIEVHKNYKGNENLKKTYVLISAFSDKSNVVPVQLEVKNFENQPNGLYLNVVLSKIKESAVITESLLGSMTDSIPLVADSNISLSQLFSNVNPADKREVHQRVVKRQVVRQCCSRQKQRLCTQISRHSARYNQFDQRLSQRQNRKSSDSKRAVGRRKGA